MATLMSFAEEAEEDDEDDEEKELVGAGGGGRKSCIKTEEGDIIVVDWIGITQGNVSGFGLLLLVIVAWVMVCVL